MMIGIIGAAAAVVVAIVLVGCCVVRAKRQATRKKAADVQITRFNESVVTAVDHTVHDMNNSLPGKSVDEELRNMSDANEQDAEEGESRI